MTDATPATRAKLPLHWKMAIGFGVGLLVGLIVHATGQGDAAGIGSSTALFCESGR
jgi:DAACS family dicarboxylate/amino acid:cation (Na+ or H+) symporter